MAKLKNHKPPKFINAEINDNTVAPFIRESASKILTVSEENALIKLAKEGDVDARNRVLSQHTGSIITVANQFHRRGHRLSISDLINEGTLGMIHAIDKYEFESGAKFFTYATWWVSAFINKAVNSSYIIHIPANQLIAMRKAIKENRSSANTESIENNGDDNYTDDVRRCMAIVSTASMDEDPVMGSRVSSNDIGHDERMEVSDRDKKIAYALTCLTQKEKDVIIMYYGINHPACTLEEIGDELDMSIEGVRRIRIRAIEKIYKNKDARAMLKEYA